MQSVAIISAQIVHLLFWFITTIKIIINNNAMRATMQSWVGTKRKVALYFILIKIPLKLKIEMLLY